MCPYHSITLCFDFSIHLDFKLYYTVINCLVGIKTCNVNSPNPHQHVRDYFSPHPVEKVGRDDLQRLLAESLFNCLLSQLTAADLLEIDNYISLVEQDMDIRFPPHTIGTLPPLMRLHFDPVVAYAKPLLFYGAVRSADLCSDLMLWALGFRRKQVAGSALTYWVLEGDSGCTTPAEAAACAESGTVTSPQQHPVMFIHGVGLGLVTYVTFINSLVGAYRPGSRPPLLLLELPHVSMKLNVEVIPSMPDTVNSIAQALWQEGGYTQAQFVVHSLGSFIFGAVQYMRPSLVAGVVLVDPVCFQLWEPSVMSNFCYRVPDTVMQILMHYHITHELTINHYFHRHFIWTDCVLFAENLPAYSCVVLSELDEIINAPGVNSYLQRSKRSRSLSSEREETGLEGGREERRSEVQVQMLAGRHHGEWNVHLPSLRQVVGAVVDMGRDLDMDLALA